MSRIYISKATKRFIRTRACGCCEYCQSLEAFSTHSFSIEHLIPISLGGDNGLNNLALSCQGCNGHKYNKIAVFDRATKSEVPLFNPRKERWIKHFRWNGDFTLILPVTAIGRITIHTLKLNRPNLLNLRKAVFLMGEHPPIHTIA